MKKTILYFFLLLMFFGCKTDDLFVEDLAALKGSFMWEYSYYFERNCIFCSRGQHRFSYPDDDGYSARITFGDKNRITFYIDDEELTDRPFKVLDKERVNNELHVHLKVDTRKKDLDINDNITLVYYNDTLEIDKFPHSGYSGERRGRNYFIRK